MRFMSVKYMILLMLVMVTASLPARATSMNPQCPDANLFTNVFDQICWDCFLDSISLMGVSVEDEPDGAANKLPVCFCSDALGVPEVGWPLAYWRPARVNEVVLTPWCAPGLGGIKLQDTMTGVGTSDTVGDGRTNQSSFYQYHYYSYPIMDMLGMLIMPNCSDGYVDMDLLYLSEVDPLWQSDMLSLILNPEAIIFANPAAMLWCMQDCISTTANEQLEESFGCAGCSGSLYPMTGNVTREPDQVAASSLITQRVLAGLHRKGLARKTIGDEAMCEPEYYPTIPRSQYRFSMMYPVPEASSDLAASTVSYAQENSSNESQFADNLAGASGGDTDAFKQCCHPMGMSTARWCTPYGGRERPGKDAYLYLIWNWRDCCNRGTAE
ncbi:type IV conjugative transfer system protein TraU (plasmid) [Alteromonas mediterranea 615]|uniref:Type IV conjugative transfer system protein TraU n=1 Tax=Alteromonas mediterranea 615 TaxID=1300253 RepID=S5AL21_9ALTE|nr:type IV conjugative transfer system protein TraU [Alteromonas mediterranea 615]|tara:strand:+ start:5771 stop:6919 length:1149 start_codon:yes stop_codon:yes gene_type:complete